MVLVHYASSSTMIEFKEIDPKGIAEKDMDPEMKKIHQAMQRGVREARKEYKRLGLTMVTADRNGKIVYKKP